MVTGPRRRRVRKSGPADVRAGLRSRRRRGPEARGPHPAPSRKRAERGAHASEHGSELLLREEDGGGELLLRTRGRARA